MPQRGCRMRLNKYLAQCGVCSRRDADKLIEQGKVLVNGQVAGMGQQVLETDTVQVGKRFYRGNRPAKSWLSTSRWASSAQSGIHMRRKDHGHDPLPGEIDLCRTPGQRFRGTDPSDQRRRPYQCHDAGSKPP